MKHTLQLYLLRTLYIYMCVCTHEYVFVGYNTRDSRGLTQKQLTRWGVTGPLTQSRLKLNFNKAPERRVHLFYSLSLSFSLLGWTGPKCTCNEEIRTKKNIKKVSKKFFTSKQCLYGCLDEERQSAQPQTKLFHAFLQLLICHIHTHKYTLGHIYVRGSMPNARVSPR